MATTRKPNPEIDLGEPRPSESLHRLAAARETILQDVGDELLQARIWQQERELFRAMIDQVPDYLFVKDRDSRFVIANKAVAADLGLEPEALIGKSDLELHPPLLAAKFFADEQDVVRTEKAMLDIEEFVIQPSGAQRWLSTSKVPLRDADGRVIGIVGISRDVTDRKEAEAKIQHMAHHDALTGLPNRTLLRDRLSQAIGKARRDQTSVAAIFVDLDKFKFINDRPGHNIGDGLLKVVAERMLSTIRATDTVGRLSGDEFLILLDERGAGGASQTIEIIRRLQRAIAEPITIEGHLLRVTSSFGVAVFPKDASDPDTLIKNADLAMYECKNGRREGFTFYAPEMDANAAERRQLEEGLRLGIARNEFELVYQPQVDLVSGKIRAVEALVRWHHPELGLLMPLRFIPLAEETGAILELGSWILGEACRQNAAWQKAGLPKIPVAVNVSARQFRDKTFVERVTDALGENDLEPRYLELEITESLLMEDVEEAAATMLDLQQLGITFAIDDFGTGYSSLSALKSFPISHLKIDRSFIENLSRDPRDRSIAQAVISMAKKLHMRVVAEGVEREEQLAFLKSNNCDEAQGFYMSEPVPAGAIAAILAED